MAYGDAQSGGTVYALMAAIPITLAGTVSKGDAVGFSTGWKRALATAGGVIQGRLVALQDGVSGKVIKAAVAAYVGGRFSEMEPGDPMYVEEGTGAGKYTQTLPSDLNDATTVVGHAITATEALISFVRPDTLSAG